jgi:ABC-type Mn2+/Zn2+ transport system ATPase subunit
VRWAPDVKLGYVPQKLDIERDVPITGVDFLRARARLARGSAPDIHRTLDLVGVSPEIAERPIGTLSGGQFQRLLVGFALLGNPSVLLLDEPTAGVDEPGQRQLDDLVHRLREQQDLTVLFISHELTIVYRYATNVLCLGRTRACFGQPRAILTPELLQEVYGAPVDYHVHER